MSEWRDAETFDYEAESARQGTIFVRVWASDGEIVELVEHWGDSGLIGGWKDFKNADRDGPIDLCWTPTYWMPLIVPEPPTNSA